MIRILAVSGSSRRASLNQKLLDQAASGARAAGAEVTAVRLSDFELPIYDLDLEAERGLPEGASALKALLGSHQGCSLRRLSTTAATLHCSRTPWTG